MIVTSPTIATEIRERGIPCDDDCKVWIDDGYDAVSLTLEVRPNWYVVETYGERDGFSRRFFDYLPDAIDHYASIVSDHSHMGTV